MAHKGNKSKSAATTSTPIMVTAFSLLHPSCLEDFEKFHKNRSFVKQHVYYPTVAARLNIPEVVDIMKH